MSAFKPFLQYFATGSETASYKDYEEYEFVERLSEETRITDLFTTTKAFSIHTGNSSEFLLVLDSIR